MMAWLFSGRRERLRRQAADWIAKLNGPHGTDDVDAFERWYRADPDNAAAFDRLSALFDVAEGVPAVASAAATELPEKRRLRAGYALAAVAASACIIVLALAVSAIRELNPAAPNGVQLAVFATTGAENRQVQLVDGSEVVLAPGSELDVAIDGTARRLQLRQGEGRFTVFPDTRPFVVTAAGAEIVARGTRFFVRLDADGTFVSLIEGRVEVSYPPEPGRAERRRASLVPGQRLVLPLGSAPSAAPAVSVRAETAPVMIEFDDTPLDEAVSQINRRAELPVRLADPALAELRITGAFRAGDTAGFAQAVVVALELHLRQAEDGLWLGVPPGRRP